MLDLLDFYNGTKIPVERFSIVRKQPAKSRGFICQTAQTIVTDVDVR